MNQTWLKLPVAVHLDAHPSPHNPLYMHVLHICTATRSTALVPGVQLWHSIPHHLCSTYGRLWWLVVVWLS